MLAQEALCALGVRVYDMLPKFTLVQSQKPLSGWL